MSQLPPAPPLTPRQRLGRGDLSAGWVRVVVMPPPDFEVLTALWVKAGPAAGTFTFLHDYPDLAVAPGWRLESGGRRYEVRAVGGRELRCEPVEG